MKKILSKSQIDEIVEILNREEIIALPTDTIYGFSCLPTSEKAVKKLCELKQCDEEKMFIILVSKNYDLSKLVKMTSNIVEFVKNNTPNPLTMIMEKQDSLNFAKNFKIPTLAIRIPDNEFLQKVLDKVGFMISTSANIHGQPNLNDMNEIITKFNNLDYIVKDDVKKDAKASTIVDLTTSEIKVLRQGVYLLKKD